MYQFPVYVLDGCHGMIEHHPWPRPSHDIPDALLHLRTVAMDGAFLACRFPFAVTAPVQSGMGILQQFTTFRAHLAVAFLFPAIQAYHLFHDLLFFRYTTIALFHIYKSRFQVQR